MRRTLAFSILGLALAASTFVTLPAYASFTSKPTASLTITSATFNPPTNLVVTPNCGPRTASLTWTATTSTFATGYTVVDQVNGGATTTVQSGLTTPSYTMSLIHRDSYIVAVEATYKSWTSATTSWSTAFQC